ncbi:histidine phosphatase family protein ['Paenibacillus yunnanensis' Narsing Rao et al. 2020]|uniref:histidine phosphatase family protein n=1 Tax=Paenibacillus tengchongensis TaxID=2608684 RepID=UPI00124F3ECB|nr:histidine phosphatase family protein [Paenibacillus tengchongensis]
MAIYFIRHGMDDEGYRGGWSQRGLNAEGYRQSEKLGRYLKERQNKLNIHRIISSDLQRALDTAGEIARELELPVEQGGAWRETNNGVIAGMPNEIVEERYPGLYFSALTMEERYPGGESPLEFFTRIKRAFTLLCEEQSSRESQENVVVVTHGGVINAVYHLLKDTEWSNKGGKAYPSLYTSVHTIEHGAGGWQVTAENRTDHL